MVSTIILVNPAVVFSKKKKEVWGWFAVFSLAFLVFVFFNLTEFSHTVKGQG